MHHFTMAPINSKLHDRQMSSLSSYSNDIACFLLFDCKDHGSVYNENSDFSFAVATMYIPRWILITFETAGMQSIC